VGLDSDLERAGALALAHVGKGDVVSGVLATESEPGRRIYVCSIDGTDGMRGWLAVDAEGSAVTTRAVLRAAVSIAALCEVAADAAGGGDLDGLIASIVDLHEREAPEGIEDAEAAARALRALVGDPPQLASPERLD
jgi:hypothetical protein